MIPPPGTSSVTVLLVLVIVSLQLEVKLCGATVTVGVLSQWADEGSNNSVTCFPSEPILSLMWYKSSTTEEFTDAQSILRLFVLTGFVTFDPNVNASHYSFDESATDYPLTIKGVGFDDELRYWCDVDLDSGPNESGKTSFQVRRIPASIVLKHGDTSYTDGDKAVVIEGENQFECSVPNIKPAAQFTWRLGSEDQDSFTVRNETSDDPRLVDSYSILTAFVDKENSELICSAQNKQDGTTTPDQTISIILDKKDNQCKVGPCLNGGTCSPTAEGFQCDCVDGFKGDTCAEDKPTQEPPGDFPIWIIVVIVVVICVAIVITIVVICRCKQKGHDEGRVDNGSDTPMK